jgi:hypothetical protein
MNSGSLKIDILWKMRESPVATKEKLLGDKSDSDISKI